MSEQKKWIIDQFEELELKLKNNKKSGIHHKCYSVTFVNKCIKSLKKEINEEIK